MLNRAAVTVKPAKPYISWAAQLDDSGIVPSENSEKTVYLIPEYENDQDAMKVLSEAYGFIFERELEAWHLDESVWPKNRTFKMFIEWFEVELCTMVDDICGYELVDDDIA